MSIKLWKQIRSLRSPIQQQMVKNPAAWHGGVIEKKNCGHTERSHMYNIIWQLQLFLKTPQLLANYKIAFSPPKKTWIGRILQRWRRVTRHWSGLPDSGSASIINDILSDRNSERPGIEATRRPGMKNRRLFAKNPSPRDKMTQWIRNIWLG